MEIRKSTKNDIDEILSIFNKAREYMVANGNPTQWSEGYPDQTVLEADIANGNSYVIVDHGMIVATFAFIIGEEPTYRVIKNGEWRLNVPYGTIHRVASSGKAKGITKCCFDYCASQIDYLRIDTHEDNKTMQAAIKKYGFCRCGIIYVSDNSERIAYDFYTGNKLTE